MEDLASFIDFLTCFTRGKSYYGDGTAWYLVESPASAESTARFQPRIGLRHFYWRGRAGMSRTVDCFGLGSGLERVTRAFCLSLPKIAIPSQPRCQPSESQFPFWSRMVTSLNVRDLC